MAINVSPFATNVIDIANRPLISASGQSVFVQWSGGDFVILVDGKEYTRTPNNLSASYALNCLEVSYA